MVFHWHLFRLFTSLPVITSLRKPRLSHNKRKVLLSAYLLTATGPPRTLTFTIVDKFGISTRVSFLADSNGKFIGPYSVESNRSARATLIEVFGYPKYLELISYAA